MDEARALADQVTVGVVSAAQALAWCNAGYAELVDMITNLDPDRYLLSTNIATAQGTPNYELPEDFARGRRVDLIVGGRPYPVKRFELQEPPYSSFDPMATPAGAGTRYRFVGNEIWFDPDPGTNTYRLYYVQAPQFLDANDSIDGVAGWESWIACFIAIRMKIKEDKDASTMALSAEMSRIESRIKASASRRDSGSGETVADVQPRGGIY
jgi:hypothetical protein